MLFLVLIFFLVFTPTVSAQTATPSATIAPGTVLLSEIFACQGAGEKEWVEIQNTGTSEITLTDWRLRDTTATNKYVFNQIVPANGYVTIELPSTMYNDSGGDTVKLVDGTDSNVVSEYSYPSCDNAWVWARSAGEWKQSTTKTAGKANTITPPATATPAQTSTPTPSPTPHVTPTQTSTPTPSPTPGAQPTSVGLSEIYACQADGTKEWVELTNSAGTSVTLTNWKLTDDDNNDQVIPSLTIPPKGVAVVEITKYSRGMLTNDGDIVSLYDATGKKVDSYEYSECTQDQSWAKTSGTWGQTTHMSRGQVNPLLTTPSPEPIATDSPEVDGDGEVLGSQTTTESPELTPEPTPIAQTAGRGRAILALICIGMGVLTLTGIGGYLAWEPYLKRYYDRIVKKA